MNYALFFKNLSFYNELYTARQGAILKPFWHREGSMAEQSRAEPSRPEPSRAEPNRAGTGRASPSRSEPSRAKPSRFEPSRAKPSQAEPNRRRPTRHMVQKHNVLQWIIHFHTPFTKHQFLQGVGRLCYKNINIYNEIDRPPQTNTKSCKNTMFYNEFWTCFKNISFYNELCICS